MKFTLFTLRARNEGNGTKRSWVSFYNQEAENVLNQYLIKTKSSKPVLFGLSMQTSLKTWRAVSKRSGVKVTPQVLRNWFCSEMGRLGVQDRYVDAFCGRTPKSILARHYTDYSPEKLQEIYEKAHLNVLT